MVHHPLLAHQIWCLRVSLGDIDRLRAQKIRLLVWRGPTIDLVEHTKRRELINVLCFKKSRELNNGMKWRDVMGQDIYIHAPNPTLMANPKVEYYYIYGEGICLWHPKQAWDVNVHYPNCGPCGGTVT